MRIQMVRKWSERLGTTIAILACLSFANFGCAGYQFKNASRSSLVHVYGVSTVFVRPIVNDTYKAGVENLVYSQVLRLLASQPGVRVVREEALAEAVVSGRVAEAGYTMSATTTTDRLFPSTLNLGLSGSADTPIAAEFRAVLGFSLELRKRDGGPHPLWASAFNRSRTFPSNFQLGVYGSTSNLLNESEFDRMLRELAQTMMVDVQESMLSRF